MSSLFHQTEVLRAKHHREPAFNLFSVLRKESDEKFLHSRFLAFLLNPQSNHTCGSALLQSFLDVMNIDDFDVKTARVQTEYKSIDIFISNAEGKAIILENKIYASDAREQLVRYEQTARREGYQSVINLYLTLTGSEPAEHSKGNLEVEQISYQTDILAWLDQCIALVAREPGLREAIFQYIELLKRLTSTDQGGAYMDALKSELLKGENLLLVNDIQQAFTEVLIDLQEDIWEKMRAYQLEAYPNMPPPEDNAERQAIRNYYMKSKSNRYYGLYYSLAPLPGYAYVEVDHYLYCGFMEADTTKNTGRQHLLRITRGLSGGAQEADGLYWRHSSPKARLHNPTRADLDLLRDPEQRQAIARNLIDGVHELWQAATSS
ncbi:PD-(D/E)XK nuclease family protein [Pseudomonas sp. PSE14]|uniref:PDDEXK-like family protein n=1 Tax=Pseudomonas sp. PSE14 TaxID=3016341 RepID=UPI0023D8A687|nr:PD-(D/E)XK nuclease family protein [Pseudomonas sp. PSE14]WEJ70364.1 PD-(D/E)XK nuclease family protein [Pseudomonas sp. PSE14]